LDGFFNSVASRQAGHRRFLGAALAILVGVLALQAKLSLYDPPHSGSINPVSTSKLWVNGEKLETAAPGLLPVLWVAALLSFPPPARRILRSEPGSRAPAPRHLWLYELYRFLRPPPAF